MQSHTLCKELASARNLYKLAAALLQHLTVLSFCELNRDKASADSFTARLFELMSSDTFFEVVSVALFRISSQAFRIYMTMIYHDIP